MISRKRCLNCKRKRQLDKLKVVDIKMVQLCLYCCIDKKKCLHYQLENKRND